MTFSSKSVVVNENFLKMEWPFWERKLQNKVRSMRMQWNKENNNGPSLQGRKPKN
jgi:hypothetical protein